MLLCNFTLCFLCGILSSSLPIFGVLSAFVATFVVAIFKHRYFWIYCTLSWLDQRQYSIHRQRVIQSNKTINLSRWTQTLFIPPNQIYNCWQWKKSAECYNLCSVVKLYDSINSSTLNAFFHRTYRMIKNNWESPTRLFNPISPPSLRLVMDAFERVQLVGLIGKNTIFFLISTVHWW